MKIDFIGNYCEHIETVVNWLDREFGIESSKKFYRDIIEHSTNKGKLPVTFVAIENDEVVGTVGVWRSDLLSRQDLYPWISALVVREDYRNKGIGTKLQKFALNYCREENLNEVYLYIDIEDYYEKIGWTCIDTGYEYSGSEVKIYKWSMASIYYDEKLYK